MLGNRVTRALVGTMVLAIIATTLAPAAEAGHHKGRRYKDDSYDSRFEGRGYRSGSHRRGHDRGYSRNRDGYRTRVVEVRRSSGYAPALAGFIGGLAVGTVIGRQGQYAYYDSYCDRSYSSLDACGSHYRSCDHPRVIRLVNSGGRCVDTYRWQGNSGWVDSGDEYDDWGDRGDDRDDGGYDQGGCRH